MKSFKVVSLKLFREKTGTYEGRITSPDIAAKALQKFYNNAATESLAIVALNVKNEINAVRFWSGGQAGVAVCVSDILRFALVADACAIIMAHNHPSGDVTPSTEDFSLTDTVKKGCKAVGIGFLDHIILGENEYYSIKNQGKVAL